MKQMGAKSEQAERSGVGMEAMMYGWKGGGRREEGLKTAYKVLKKSGNRRRGRNTVDISGIHFWRYFEDF